MIVMKGRILNKAKLSELFRQIRKIFFRNATLTIGTFLVILVVFAAVFGPLLTDVNPIKSHLRERNKPPSPEHLFGTDTYGRDLLVRIIYGARNSLGLAMVITLTTAAIASVLGIAAPWFRSLDNVLMRIMDMFMSIPSLILSIALVGFLGASQTNVVIAIVITQVPRMTRVVRYGVISVRESEGLLLSQVGGTCCRRDGDTSAQLGGSP